jgi:hypothetical protein
MTLHVPFLHPRAVTLQRFAEETIPETGRARVAAHLERCVRCRAEVMALRGLWRDARRVETLAAPAAVLERVRRDRAEGRRIILPVATPTPNRTPFRAHTLIAAVTLLVTVGTVGFLSRQVLRSRALPRVVRDSIAVPQLPTLHGMLIDVGFLPTVAYAEEAAGKRRAPPITGMDGSRIRPFTMSYELTYSGAKVEAAPERGEGKVERAMLNGVPAWRIVSVWRGHDVDMPETTYVAEQSLVPMFRVARNVGFSLFTVVQRFQRDSLVGWMWSAKSSRAIARRLPPDQGPFLAGEHMPVIVLQAVPLRTGWSGSASILGWGAVASDLVYPIEFRVVGEERITVPAGTFECWKLVVSAGRREKQLWVRKSDQLVVMSRDSTANPGVVQQVVLISAHIVP